MIAQRATESSKIALPKTYTTAERRQAAIAAFEAFGERRLPSLREVERTNISILDIETTERTILSVIVEAFRHAGDNTKATVGAVRGKLGMSQDDVNEAFCYCVNGAEMSGNQAAARLKALC